MRVPQPSPPDTDLGTLTLIVPLRMNDLPRLRLALQGRTNIRAECKGWPSMSKKQQRVKKLRMQPPPYDGNLEMPAQKYICISLWMQEF